MKKPLSKSVVHAEKEDQLFAVARWRWAIGYRHRLDRVGFLAR
jgi:hypothetical protein